MAENDEDGNGGGLSKAQAAEIEERSNPTTPVVYEVLRLEGESEMSRPLVSLWWSGTAAGMSIGFSLITEAILRTYLPNEPWRPLVTRLGYAVGFLIVVLGRQQLFTENTITAVLPVAKDFTLPNLARMGRLWGVVLIANMAGCLVGAVLSGLPPTIPPEIQKAMLAIAREDLLPQPWIMLLRAIPAGFLIAAMVWLLPTAAHAQFHVITLMTWLVAVGGFKHVVAGSFEMFDLVVSGQLGLGAMIVGFLLPVLVGNIIGGTGLFALISYGQVAKEI